MTQMQQESYNKFIRNKKMSSNRSPAVSSFNPQRSSPYNSYFQNKNQYKQSTVGQANDTTTKLFAQHAGKSTYTDTHDQNNNKNSNKESINTADYNNNVPNSRKQSGQYAKNEKDDHEQKHEQKTNIKFSQFQEQYEQLRHKYQKTQRDYEELSLQKKKLQIKIINANTQYYDKQIKRLRVQLERYQQQNQQNKYLYIKAQNLRKQLQASLKLKNTQLKNYIKSYETLKVSNIQLKYQNQDKQRVFTRVRQQLQKSNQFINNKLAETHRKYVNSQTKLKAINADYDSLQSRHERLSTKDHQLQSTYKKLKITTQEKIRKLSQNLQARENEINKLNNKHRKTEQQLTEQIQRYKSERTSVQLLTAKRNENISVIKNSRLLQLQVVRAQQKIKQLQFENDTKNTTIKHLEQKISQLRQNSQAEDLMMQVRELTEQKHEIVKNYERHNQQLRRQCQNLRIQLLNSHQNLTNSRHSYSSNNNNNNKNDGSKNFQEILRVQLQQNAHLKKQLGTKIDIIFNLKSDIEQLRVEKSNIKSQLQVIEKKRKSEQKNNKIQQDIHGHNLKNDVQSLKRKIEVLQTKLSCKIKQVKEKDNFIVTSIVGRSRKQDVPIILADLQRIFQASYMQKLIEANQKIEQLTTRLQS